MAFVVEAALIALREGLEALLITGILLGLVTKLGRPDLRKHVWLGFAAAVVASLGLGLAVQRWLLEPFEEQGGAEWFEIAAVVTAVIVLTYMVFWMWQHTRAIMATMREKVAQLITRGALAGIVLLAFASVLREGVEVVLFYGALASRATPMDLAWSGMVGFVASAGLVWLILSGVKRLDLRRFFAVTGLMLVFVAGGLLVHGVSAAMGLGLLPPAHAVWDTSAALPDDSALGRVLHALVGYASTPTLLQAVLYFGYVFGVGGTYLWKLGVFHARGATGRSYRPAPIAAGIVLILLVASTVGAGVARPGVLVTGHDHDDGHDDHALARAQVPADMKVGVLLRSHGEPVHYNETTYRSFADFVRGLLTTLGMQDLLLVDQGTVLLDKERPFGKGPRVDAELMDAWTHAHPGPAVYTGSPVPEFEQTQLPLMDGVYLAPGGPGLGEPDILEWAGLTAYLDWLQMENESPMHATKLHVLEAARALIEARHGDRVVVQTSYHLLPRLGPGESDADAAQAFVAADVDVVVDAYTSTIFSDVMNTCMMRPHLLHALDEAGFRGRVVHAEQPGLTRAYGHAVARHVEALVQQHPAGEQIAVFLTHHGQSPDAKNPCDAAGGADQYNANARALHENVLDALKDHVDTPRVRFYQVYGQGADASDDGIMSPSEALADARAWGALHVIDLPFELTGDGYDNLVVQRASYGLAEENAPHYDANRETRLTLQGMNVLIASAAFEPGARGEALAEVVERAIAAAVQTQPEQEEPGHAHTATTVATHGRHAPLSQRLHRM